MKYHCKLIIKDLSPKYKHVNCNCTTRSLAYILKNKMSYEEIWNEQHRLANLPKNIRNGLKWNYDGVWDSVLFKYGFIWIKFQKRIRRDKLAELLKSIPAPFISYSFEHVSIIDKGKVVDIWDCRLGQVHSILINKKYLVRVVKLLGSSSFSEVII